jgi:hypothetical protein
MLPTLWPFVHRWRENTLAGCVGSVRLFPAATLSRWGCAFCMLACYCSHSSRCRIPHRILGEYERGSENSQTLLCASSSPGLQLRLLVEERERNEGEVGWWDNAEVGPTDIFYSDAHSGTRAAGYDLFLRCKNDSHMAENTHPHPLTCWK